MLDLSATPRHDQLYLYAKVRQEQMQMARSTQSPDLTFTPQVNDYECQRTRMNFFERQQADCHEREYKQQLIRESQSTTNLRRQMQPQLYRPSSAAFRGEPGVALYDAAFKSLATIEAMRRQQDAALKHMANEQKSIATSSMMVDKNVDARLKTIFETLDSDGDGLINYSRINVEGIDPKVCKVLSPLLLELNDRPDISLDYRSFVLMVKEFMKVDSCHEAYLDS